MEFRLTPEQESCLQNAANQPVGRKGHKWLAWANRVLRAAGLGEVKVLEAPISDPGPPPKVSGLQKPKGGPQLAFQAPAQGLQIVLDGQQQRSSIQIPRTFVVQSGVLTGPGVSITIEKGSLKGYFLESGETRSKASRDSLSLMAGGGSKARHGAAGDAAGGSKEAAAAAGGSKDRHGAAGGSKEGGAAAGGSKGAAGGSKDKAVAAAGGPKGAAGGSKDKAVAAAGGSKGAAGGFKDKAVAAAGGSSDRHGLAGDAAGGFKRKASAVNGPNKQPKVVDYSSSEDNEDSKGKKDNSSEEGEDNSKGKEDSDNSKGEDDDSSKGEDVVEASEELV